MIAAMTRMALVITALLAATLIRAAPASGDGAPEALRREFPKTDFSRAVVPLESIVSGGPPRDGIRSVDEPRFDPVARPRLHLSASDPVIAFVHAGRARAYPLAILARHEIVNDRLGELPVAVTYCPLCNAAIVFRRVLPDGTVTTFGTTGRLRNSDLVMYDRATETFWQQFTGRGLVGRFAGDHLERLPARIMSFARFRAEHPDGEVLSPPYPWYDYRSPPYAGYDRSPAPWFPVRRLPREVPAMSLVVSVGDRAWALDLVRRKGRITTEDGLVITWRPGARSIFRAPLPEESGKPSDVWGDVMVERLRADGTREPVPYGLDFAFAFASFHPDSRIETGR
ncbi:MAG: hypothetical protein KatS3mg082_2420 [Nitrospiraceae bacterium]|nr:MAG: hypothetical protein KatS3mg082_2420 [Nitrospiraceae bacterium]